MRWLVKRLVGLLRSRQGTTAVEYAVMAMLVFLAVMSVVTFFGQRTAESFDSSDSALQETLDSRP